MPHEVPLFVLTARRGVCLLPLSCKERNGPGITAVTKRLCLLLLQRGYVTSNNDVYLILSHRRTAAYRPKMSRLRRITKQFKKCAGTSLMLESFPQKVN